MESIFTAMRRCQLFDGIPEDKYQNVLNCLHGEVRTIPRNTVLLRIGERAAPPRRCDVRHPENFALQRGRESADH